MTCFLDGVHGDRMLATKDECLRCMVMCILNVLDACLLRESKTCNVQKGLKMVQGLKVYHNFLHDTTISLEYHQNYWKVPILFSLFDRKVQNHISDTQFFPNFLVLCIN